MADKMNCETEGYQLLGQSRRLEELAAFAKFILEEHFAEFVAALLHELRVLADSTVASTAESRR